MLRVGYNQYSHRSPYPIPSVFYKSVKTEKMIVIYLLVPSPTENGGDVRLFDLAKSVHWIVEEGGGIGLKRRKRVGLGLDGSDDEDVNLPPTNDIYRQRQQKRVK